ncbi:MAG: mandelate racemase/muconate lactonizing enzyme family protein [Anaerolineae bacterium]|nr:mandelate racemase/muconate lactonizing enzyme family protein [Anaerolineae bacterium]
MKITGVRTQIYEFDLQRWLGDANNPRGWLRNIGLAVFLDTDEGLTGVALGGVGAQSVIHGLVNDLMIGADPRGVRGLWQKMNDHVFKGGNHGVVGSAVSTLDIALWDLKAKINGEPLWRTLGALDGRVRAYASGLDMPLNDDELRQYYERMAAQGVWAGKLKVGLNRDDDLRRLGIMHDALAKSGKKPELMIDSNEYWSPKQAIAHIRHFESHYELVWAEEPARRWDYAGLRKVSDNVQAAVSTGENLNELHEYRLLIEHRAADIIQVGSNCAGITGALMVAELAYAFETPMSWMNCAANHLAHVAAAIPNHITMEVLQAGRDKILNHNHRIVDGWIVLSDAPGLGIEFDPEKLAAHTVATPSPAPRSGRRVGAALYQVPEEMQIPGSTGKA